MTAWASSVIALPLSVPVNESHHRGPSRVSRDGSERWGCGGHVGAPTSIGGLWLALALLPARTRVDGLEPALGREIPRHTVCFSPSQPIWVTTPVASTFCPFSN